MIATALLLRALCNRHDEWVLRGGAGGSEGTTCASVQTRRLAAPPRWARCRLCSEQAGWLHAGAPPGSSWEHFSASLEMKVRQFFCHVRKQQPVVSQGPKDKRLFFQAKMAKSKVWEHGHGVVSGMGRSEWHIGISAASAEIHWAVVTTHSLAAVTQFKRVWHLPCHSSHWPLTDDLCSCIHPIRLILCISLHTGARVVSLPHYSIKKANYFIWAKIISEIMQNNSDITHAIFCSVQENLQFM